MSVGPFQLLIIALVIVVLFGRGRISEMLGDFGAGVKRFREGLGEDDNPAMRPQRVAAQAHEADAAAELRPDSTAL